MEVRVLGPLEVVDGDQTLAVGGRRLREMVALLAVGHGRVVSEDGLVDALWRDGALPTQPHRTIQSYVSRLRAVLGTESISTVPPGYRLNGEVRIDAVDFESRLDAARRLRGAEPERSRALYERTLGAWRGRAFEGLEDVPAAVAEAARLEELHVAATEELLELGLATGPPDDVAAFDQLARGHPLREKPAELLMRALYGRGRQAEALRVFQDHRRAMADAGLVPSDRLVSLERRMSAADPGLDNEIIGRPLRGYRLLEVVGEGAFGLVYRATQPGVGREVAIKVVRQELADDPDFIRRFEAEAQLVARLEHPHIVPLYDFWREPGGAYLVFRYLRGGTLEQRLDRSGPWAIDETVRLVGELAGALSVAHGVGVMHRDVKPANILFDDSDHSYLADFGIAVDATSDDRNGAASAGSPMYVSPEQLAGDGVSPRSDVYSLALVVQEVLTGRPAFSGGSIAELLVRKRAGDVESLARLRPELPPSAIDVMSAAVSVEPRDRPASVDAFRTAFVGSFAGTPRAGTMPAGATATARPVPIDVEIANPYKGLRAFQEADAIDFFGRDDVREELLRRVRNERLLVVVGPSGSGKSSVVRAGLIPALREAAAPGAGGGWFVVTMVPGPDPYHQLEEAMDAVAVERPARLGETLRGSERGVAEAVRALLPDRSAPLLLVIDQFEELFTLTRPDLRDRFLAALVEASHDTSAPLRIVVTVRADYYDRPLGDPELGPLVRRSTVAIAPLSPDELERTIAGPAQRAGLSVEPALQAELIADVAHRAGTLPLLQYALTELFERRDGTVLTLAAYREIGGVSGALARRADELYAGLAEDEKLAVRQLFGRLVAPGELGSDTRRRAVRSELAGVPPDVIDRLGDARLLSFDRDAATREPTVEVAHEALITEWPRLREWIERDRDGIRVLRHLGDAARSWVTGGEDDGDLYRGARLGTVLDWVEQTDPALSDLEGRFLAASRAVRDDEVAAERRRGEQRERQNRRLRRLLMVAGAAAVVAIVLGLLAVQQRSRADDEADQAVAARSDAETRRLAADAPALANSNRRVALLMAAEAYRRDPGPATLGSLQRVLTSTEGLLGYLGDGEYRLAAWRPGTDQLLGLRADGVDLFDTATGERLLEIPVVAGEAFAVSPDGTHVAIATTSDAVMYDLDTGVRFGDRLPHDSVVLALQFSPDGSQLATGDRAGTLRIFDVSTGTILSSAAAHPEDSFADVAVPDDVVLNAPHEPASYPIGVHDLAWHPEGTKVATVGGIFIRQFDAATAAQVAEVQVNRPSAATTERLVGRPAQVDYTSDGSALVVRTNRYVQRWSAGDGALLDELAVEVSDTAGALVAGGTVETALAGDVLVVAELDSLTLLDVGTGRPIAPTVDVQTTSGLGNVAIDTDGRTVAVAGRAGIVVWAIDGRQLLADVIPRDATGRGLHVTDDGTFVSTHAGNVTTLEGVDPTASLWHITGGIAEAVPLPDDRAASRVFFSGDDLVVIQHQQANLEAWALSDLRHVASYGAINNYSMATSFDGSMLALGAGAPDPAVVHVIEPRTGTPLTAPIAALSELAGEDGRIFGVAFNADGTRLAASTGNGAAVVLDTSTWDAVGPPIATGNDAVMFVAFSADGRYFATVDGDGAIILRDPETFQPLGLPLIGTTSGFRTGAASPPLAFTRDGRYLVSTIDHNGRVWDLETRTLVGGPFRSDEGVNIAPSTYGRHLAVAAGDEVLVYELAPDSWFDRACTAAGRNLTDEEWAQFGPTDSEPMPTCPRWADEEESST